METPVYLINMDRSTSRLESINRQLQDQNIDYIRIPAIDGKSKQVNVSKYYDSLHARKLCKRDLTAGEIGCALSHLETYKHISSSKSHFALILEDDVKLPVDLKQLINEVSSDNKWDILLLHHFNSRFKKFTIRRTKNYRIIDFKENAASTAAYLIRQKSALKLLNIGNPIKMPTDRLTGDSTINKLRVCGLISSPIQSMQFKSTIF